MFVLLFVFGVSVLYCGFGMLIVLCMAAVVSFGGLLGLIVMFAWEFSVDCVGYCVRAGCWSFVCLLFGRVSW